MRIHIALPALMVMNAAGEERSLCRLLSGSDGVLCFLEEGAEPTEHVLNELTERAEDFNHADIRLVFIVREKAALANNTLKRTLERLPDAEVYFDPLWETPEPAARGMYVEPDRLPLLIAVNKGTTGIYACSGYNVGSVDLVYKILCDKGMP